MTPGSSPLVDVDFAVIGAGVVGLAVAEALSRRATGSKVVVIERHQRFGMETSSHNSEVIHSGLYYETAPLKAEHCIHGKQMLYAFCRAHGIEHRRCGKFIVATTLEGVDALTEIERSAKARDVEVAWIEPSTLPESIKGPMAIAALWSPETGIVDSHGLMACLERLAKDRGVTIAYRTRFEEVERDDESGCVFSAVGPELKPFRIRARRLVNASGLGAARIARSFLNDASIEIRPCRGRYFSLSERWTGRCAWLVYPVPDAAGGLGVHLTLDLAGRCRLGPDVDWSHRDLSEPDDPRLYMFDDDPELAGAFLAAGRRLLPDLTLGDLNPGYVGVRPKLFMAGRAVSDFALAETHRGASLHLLGIESPGLTAALSLADMVATRIAWP